MIAVGISACGSGVADNAVVNVAGNPISTQAFNHWMYVAAKSQAAQSGSTSPVIVPNDPPDFNNCIAQVRKEYSTLAKTKTATLRSDCKQLFTSLSSQVLDFLIKAYWYQADANKLGLNVTNAEVQSQFEAAKKQQFGTSASQFNAFLSETGQTLDDVVYRFRVNAILQKLIAKHSKAITNADIQAYYNSHLSSFGTQETRNMKIVLATSEANALAAKKALSSGQSWATVVKKYSTDPTTKSTGGVLNGVTKQQQDATFASVSFSAPANKLLGPVKSQFGYYVFEVTKINPATQQTLAEATAQIRQQLQQTASTSAQTAVDNKAKSDWLSQTTCQAAYAMSDCKGYKAPKSSSTSTSSATATTG